MGVLRVSLVVLAVGAAMAACSEAATEPQDESFSVEGVVIVSASGQWSDGNLESPSFGSYCDEDAIGDALTVSVRGSEVSLTRLKAGKVGSRNVSLASGVAKVPTCELPFRFEGLPVGAAVYTIRAEQGEWKLSESEIRGPKIRLNTIAD